MWGVSSVGCGSGGSPLLWDAPCCSSSPWGFGRQGLACSVAFFCVPCLVVVALNSPCLVQHRAAKAVSLRGRGSCRQRWVCCSVCPLHFVCYLHVCLLHVAFCLVAYLHVCFPCFVHTCIYPGSGLQPLHLSSDRCHFSTGRALPGALTPGGWLGCVSVWVRSSSSSGTPLYACVIKLRYAGDLLECS